MYRNLALRTAMNEFVPTDIAPRTFVTHPCQIRTTDYAEKASTTRSVNSVNRGDASVDGACRRRPCHGRVYAMGARVGGGGVTRLERSGLPPVSDPKRGPFISKRAVCEIESHSIRPHG